MGSECEYHGASSNRGCSPCQSRKNRASTTLTSRGTEERIWSRSSQADGAHQTQQENFRKSPWKQIGGSASRRMQKLNSHYDFKRSPSSGPPRAHACKADEHSLRTPVTLQRAAVSHETREADRPRKLLRRLGPPTQSSLNFFTKNGSKSKKQNVG